MTAEIKELVFICHKQIKHYDTIAKELGINPEKKFTYYKPMKEALNKIKI